MEVSQINRKPAVTCTPAATLQEVAWLMRDEGVGSVIVAERGRLRGIVTDRDVIVRGLAEGMDLETPIENVMTTDIEFVTSSDDVSLAATRMATRGCRRLPVLDGLGAVEGVVTMDDLVLVFADQISKLAHTVRSEMAR
jgi:CBS domain-containing protein